MFRQLRRTGPMAVVGALLALASPALARTATVTAGAARFQVLTPTLIRAEYAADGRFENRPTMTATRDRLPVPAFRVTRSGRWLTIITRRIRLRYRLGSGPFSPANLRMMLTLAGRRVTVGPQPGDGQGNLGGWRRALDLVAAPVALNDGLLSRAGWYVLDDTATALLVPGPLGFAVRPVHPGAYQDWYVFGYGHDYRRALGDLRALTGPAPLLPRSAFGVWFSRYYPYSDADYHDLVGTFRAQRVPLDTLSIDTDFKRESDPNGAAVAASVAGAPGRPYSWDGWEWNPTLFPDPRGFIDWAHRQGIAIALNIHPSISTNDPQYPATNAAAGGLGIDSGTCHILIADPTAQCAVFDWTKPAQINAYFALHRGFVQAGADIFWLDWCCDGSSANAPGLTADTWINSLYASRQRARGTRWPAFSRAGASYSAADGFDGDTQRGGGGIFAEHRYTIQFTGDTCATWPMLGFEAQFTAEEGNVGLPYVSHDIGSFHGQPVNGQCGPLGTSALSAHLPDDLYARWVALGTFQPLDRLHSDHGDRLPWNYGPAADAAAASFLRLREGLIPYTYTLARVAYDTGLPLTRALYLEWPGRPAAYEHPYEFAYGPDMVVAPVTSPGDPAPATVWVPPGTWVDYFTGQRFRGPAVRTLSVPLSEMPVLVRAGSLIVTQPDRPFTPAGPPDQLIVTAYAGGSGQFVLYDDAGQGFGYTRGASTRTHIFATRVAGRSLVGIAPARGAFPGAPRSRSWTVRLVGVPRPRHVWVKLGLRPGRRRRFSYDRSTRTLTVRVGRVSTGGRVLINAG